MKKNLLGLGFISILCLSSCETINEISFDVSFDYGEILSKIDPDTGEKIPVIDKLYNGGRIIIDSNSEFKIRDDLLAGDKILIKYVGEIYSTETYPASHFFDDKIRGIEYELSTFSEIEDERITRNDDGGIKSIDFNSDNIQYVITDKEFTYVPLSSFKGDKIWGNANLKYIENCPSGALCAPSQFVYASFFAFNPRA